MNKLHHNIPAVYATQAEFPTSKTRYADLQEDKHCRTTNDWLAHRLPLAIPSRDHRQYVETLTSFPQTVRAGVSRLCEILGRMYHTLADK
jgi:hypothetical protein